MAFINLFLFKKMSLKQYSLMAVALISFAGCFGSNPHMSEKNTSVEMSDWDWFSIKAPTTFKKHILRDDGSIALTTYDTSSTSRVPTDFSVYLYPSLTGSCLPGLSGASKTTPLAITSGKAVWGRADVWELGRQEGYIAPFDTSNMKCGGADNVYALCSEKDGKTVVICISQMTDNPKLAEEIFRTFKWTKE